MEDSDKTKEQLINELEEMRQGITKLEASEAKCKQTEEALKESEERYKAIFESVNDAIVRLDKYGKIIDFNDRVSDILGYTRDEMIGKSIAKAGVFSLEDLPLVLKLFGKAVRGNVRQIMEWSIRHRNGSMITIEASVRLVKKNGKIEGVVAILRDITERKQSEENLRLYMESAPDGVYINDLSGTFLYGNKRAEELIGYPREELIGKSFLKLNILAKKDMIKAGKVLALGIAGKSTGPDEYELLRKDGSRIWVEINTVLLKEAGGKKVVVGFVRDITGRKRAEQTIREQRDRAKKYLDVAGVMFIGIDADERVSLVNKRASEVLGYSEKEIMGKNWFDTFIPEKIREEVRSIFRMLMAGEITPAEYFENAVLTKSGEERTIFWHNTILTDDAGNITGVLSSGEDITEQKKAEAEKLELERKAQVTNRLASVGEMASGIAHEINNPLTGVVGFSEMLLEKGLPEDLRKDVEIIHDGSKRVAGIVKRLLTFARQHKPERTYTNINEIIESTLALRKYSLETSNIEVNTSLDAELPWTMVDRGQLQQVFMNIIVNAEMEMKQARGRGKLTIKTEQIDNKIRLSFADDGPGITKENIGKVFDPFFTTKEVGEGTGLGLSLSHGIIAEHKGALYAESEAGEGATFIIELPIVEEEEKIETVEAAREDGKAIGGRILVVDDEPAILTFLKEVLGGEGYEVETTSSGEEALGMIKNKRYNLILSDIKLPGLSGIEIYEQIGKVALSLQKRVIFITGDVISADTRRFLERTKAPYVTKPFDIAGLKEGVRRAIAGAG